MCMVFYFILVIFSDIVEWNWWWFIISILFSANETRVIYKYKHTPSRYLDGIEVEEDE
jgi:hypothetical protein